MSAKQEAKSKANQQKVNGNVKAKQAVEKEGGKEKELGTFTA